MVHDDALGLLHTIYQRIDVGSVELVCTHDLAGLALCPVDAVLKDGHTMWVLENLELGEH